MFFSCWFNKINFQCIIKLYSLITDSIKSHNLTTCPHKKNNESADMCVCAQGLCGEGIVTLLKSRSH